MNITQAISRLCDRFARIYNTNPYWINDGLCGEFANGIENQGFGYAIWGDELCPIFWSTQVIILKDWFTHFAGGHCFIKYNDKFYDSECPQGCSYPDHLPFYQRQLKQFY